MFRLFVESNTQGKTKPSAASRGISDGLQVTFTRRSSKGTTHMPNGRSRLTDIA
jgi:hypothetical protein